MSIKLMSQVWECNLPPNLTLVLLSMADIADHDGTRCYPSVAHLAWKCAYSPRQIQRTIQELRARGILLVVAHDEGGRGNATEYVIKLDHLEQKIPWEIVKISLRNKGDTMSPLEKTKDDISDDKGCHAAQEKGDITDTKGRHLEHERVTSMSPQPLVNINDPLVDPLINSESDEENRERPEYRFWESVLLELQSQVPRPSYETWLKETRCIRLSSDVATILVKNTFIRDMLNERMYSLILMACSKIIPSPSEILFEVAQATEGIKS